MKKILSVSKLFLALSFVSVICFSSIFPSCSTANLSDVKLCASLNSGECSGDMSTIHSDVPAISCSANLKNAPSKTKVTFEWKHGSESLGKAEVESDGGVVNSTYKPNSTLEPGKYSVTVKIVTDNATPVSKEFSVE